MTIDEAIQHCKEQVQEQAKKGCYSCAEEHQQLAEWLKELKAYKEQGGDAISRQAVLDIAKSSKSNWIDNSVLFKRVNELPSVTSQQRANTEVLDKIRAEIEDIAFDWQEIDGEHESYMVVDLNDALNIIDKYRQEG